MNEMVARFLAEHPVDYLTVEFYKDDEILIDSLNHYRFVLS